MKWQSHNCYKRKLTPTSSVFYINCKNTVPLDTQCNQLLIKVLVTSPWYSRLNIPYFPQPEMPVLRCPPYHSSKEATLCHTWIPLFLSHTWTQEPECMFYNKINKTLRFVKSYAVFQLCFYMDMCVFSWVHSGQENLTVPCPPSVQKETAHIHLYHLGFLTFLITKKNK